MNTIDLRSIKIGERFRDAKHDENLLDSIQEVGLLQGIVVDTFEGEIVLRAGGRRYSALRVLGDRGIRVRHGDIMLKLYEVPATSYEDIDELLGKQIELAENDIRVDFTWQEKDQAILRISELVELKYGKPAEPADIIDEMFDEPPKNVAVQKKKIVEAQRRLAHMEDGVVNKAKSPTEANKIIENKLKKEKLERLARAYEGKQMTHVYTVGNAVDLVRDMDKGQFDVILSDPIYGIDMHKANAFVRTKMTEGQKHEYDDSEQTFHNIFYEEGLPSSLYDVCKDEAHAYLFCDISRFYDYEVEGEFGLIARPGLKSMMENHGWYVWPRPLVWYKGNQGSLPRPHHGPRYTYETVLFAIKGNKKTTGVYHDLIDVPKPTGMDHPAGKPPRVYYELLRRSATPGNKVLDFMAGSGQIFPGANELRCHVTALELDPQWSKFALPMMDKDLGD